jgi:hypothetical protein
VTSFEYTVATLHSRYACLSRSAWIGELITQCCTPLHCMSHYFTLLNNSVILYEMLALDVPFNCRDVVELVGKITKAPPPPLPAMYSSEVSNTISNNNIITKHTSSSRGAAQLLAPAIGARVTLYDSAT